MKNKEPTKKMGRPRKEVDYATIDKLCAIQCTGEEIASVVGVDYDTLQRKIKEDFGMTFTEYFELKRSSGKASLRRMQWKAAEAGNKTMLIWLGKQYLGQKDKQEIDATANMNITIKLEPVRRSDNGKDNTSQ